MVWPEVLESEDARAGLGAAACPMGCITASVAMVGLVVKVVFNQGGQILEDLFLESRALQRRRRVRKLRPDIEFGERKAMCAEK